MPLSTQNNNNRMMSFAESDKAMNDAQSHSNEKYMTYNYFGSINGAFGIAKKKVALQDKYDSYIENANRSRQQELQLQELARLQTVAEAIKAGTGAQYQQN
jgi:hypothetical protein